MNTEHGSEEQHFDEGSLPDLDTVVFSALDFFVGKHLPRISLEGYRRPLVIGSGNAEVVGRMLFRESNAVYANESTYEAVLASYTDINVALVISASGSKHAVSIVQALADRGISTFLLTNTDDSPASKLLAISHVRSFPKLREPYTYNVSTYLGMLLGGGDESAEMIKKHIVEEVVPVIPQDLAKYDAFFLLIPSEFANMREMFMTKFDELFGPMVTARVYTYEQAKHAKTVVPSDSEYFITFGGENESFGNPDNRLRVPLYGGIGPAGFMATVYTTIGHIQKQLPPYFKDNIVKYTEEASQLFGTPIRPIVD